MPKKIIKKSARTVSNIPPKPKYKTIDPEEHIIKPPEVLMAQTLDTNDRMLRYKKSYSCPMCDYSPIITCQKRNDIRGKLVYAQYRCRNCGHRWEDKRK